MKASALASLVTVFDLMGQVRAVFAKSFNFSVHLWAALIYLCMTAALVVICRLLEQRLGPHIHGKQRSILDVVLRGTVSA